MKRDAKRVLTRGRQKMNLQRMSLKTRISKSQTLSKKKASKLRIVKQYERFFTPTPFVWQQNDDFVFYEQPSPLKWVPSETTYGIGAQ